MEVQCASRDHGAQSLGALDLHLLGEGRHFRLYNRLGAHPNADEQPGTHFAVWAPHAQTVSVIGEFNDWSPEANPLRQIEHTGVWAGAVPEAAEGVAYRFRIISQFRGQQVERLDPFAFAHAPGEKRRSVIHRLRFDWNDAEWFQERRTNRGHPIALYEVHLGSWRRVPEEGNRPLSYREVASYLTGHLTRMGFTHVLLLDVLESEAGFFAPNPRFGSPEDLMFLVDTLHQNGIGVVLNWSPAHFPDTELGLAYFDGNRLYEQSPWPIQPEGNERACIFDFSRPEVRSFLHSSAFFWLDKYHIDALRMESLSEVLYLDVERKPGEWMPNAHGGREDLAGIALLRELNAEIAAEYPDRQTIAHQTDAWPLVSHPTGIGGLGFGYAQDQSFADETLGYLEHDSFFRKFHHGRLLQRSDRMFSEHAVLPLCYHEVREGRGSFLSRMAGDEWQRFANLRLLLGFLYLQPGKKLMFMGTEFAQWLEWNPEESLDWHLSQEPLHDGVQKWVGDLNRLYRTEKALHESDGLPAGFEWVDRQDAERSTLSFLRRDSRRSEVILAVFNFTPVVRRNFRVGVRRRGWWREILNSDAAYYGGSGQGNLGGAEAAPFRSNDLPQTLTITLPPLAVVAFKHEAAGGGQAW